MRKVKKMMFIINPVKNGKVNWWLLALYAGSGILLFAWKMGWISDELYYVIMAFLNSSGG